MAVSKSFFGIRRKSTKSHTYQTDAYGQQVTKDRVTDVKNPRSVAQMEQRMFMATASAAYAGMKQIVDHSFEGKTYGAPTMAAFTSKNLEAIRKDWNSEDQKFEYNAYKDRALHPGAYIMSQGSLIPIVSTVKNANPGVPYIYHSTNTVSGGQRLVSIIYANGTDPYSPNMLANNFGLKVGDMFTIVIIAPGTAGGYQFAWARIKLLKLDSASFSAANLSEYLSVESNCGATLAFDTSDSSVYVIWPASFKAERATSGEDAYTKVAAGVIKSAKENGVWKRSECVLETTGIEVDFFPAQTTFETYPQGENYILNGGV